MKSIGQTSGRVVIVSFVISFHVSQCSAEILIWLTGFTFNPFIVKSPSK